MADAEHPLIGWEGDPEALAPYEWDLAWDTDLCERVFDTKNEAFWCALRVAQINKQTEPAP